MALSMGRATGSIYAGRTLSALRMNGGDPAGRTFPAFPGSGYDWPAFPRSGLCTPVVQCCCKTWQIGPGETLPLLLRWDQWLSSDALQGFQLFGVASASLFDMGKAPPAPADPDIIKVLTGKVGDPDPPDNSDVAKLISMLPPNAMSLLIAASKDAPISSQYKLDLCAVACDGCEGRKITMCDCVAITIQEC